MKKFKIYTHCFDKICKDIWRDLRLAYAPTAPKVNGTMPICIADLHSWTLTCFSPVQQGTWAFPAEAAGEAKAGRRPVSHSQGQPFLCYFRWGHVVSSYLQLNDQWSTKFTDYLSWTILSTCLRGSDFCSFSWLIACFFVVGYFLSLRIQFCISSIFSRIFGTFLHKLCTIKHKEVCHCV